MSINIYEIRIAPLINSKINLVKHKYSKEMEAINTLKDAFQEKGIEYRIETDGNKTKFLNESDGELAVVVCG